MSLRRCPWFLVFLAGLFLLMSSGCSSEVGDDDDSSGNLVGDDDDSSSDEDRDGYTGEEGDCNDYDASVNPGALEVCDGIDNDCNGLIDEAADSDGDSYTVCDGDCDDADPAVNPGVLEVCADGIDNNCDGEIDESPDDDADGYGVCEGDCDDGDPAVNPAALEVCDDIDNDCDGEIYGTEDNDTDGHTVCDGDCDDGDASRHPGIADACNGIDDDCDGGVDEDSRPAAWYPDADGDGFGDAGAPAFGCAAPDGHVADDSDCDDGDDAVNPEALEVCGDGVDNNCDGLTSECAAKGPGSLAAADARVTGQKAADRAGYTSTTLIDPQEGAIPYLVIGVPGDDTAATDAGAVYLFAAPVYGAYDLAEADAVLLGVAEGDQAGFSVSAAGDLNDDGYADLVVGAPLDDGGGIDAGAVYVLYGPFSGTRSLATAEAVWVGEHAGDEAGWSVAAGDLDGEGGADLLVGAPLEDSAGTDAGAAYVIAGPLDGSHVLAEADAKLLGEHAGDRAGYTSTTRAGYTSTTVTDEGGGLEVLIGAPFADSPGTDAGTVYLLNGPLEGTLSLSSAPTRFQGESAYDRAGYTSTTLVDQNGDGVIDALIGAPWNDAGGNDAGAVYLVTGPFSEGAFGLGAAATKVVGGHAGDRAGYTSTTVIDENGDGLPDLVVGAPFEDTGGSDAGAVYIVHGPLEAGTASLEDADVRLVGELSGQNAGLSISGGIDLDGHGFGDLLIGAPGPADDSVYAGALYVVYGPASGTSYLDLSGATGRLEGSVEGSQAGRSVAMVGDVDGDGIDDLVIGAPEDSTGGTGAGAVYFFRGPIDGARALSSADAVIIGRAGDGLGASVASGDLNADGLADLLVGAPYDDTGAGNGGAVYVFVGPLEGAVALSSAAATLVGDVADGLAGWSVAATGDLNGDGGLDAVIGAPNSAGAAGAGAGRAYLVFGSRMSGVERLSEAGVILEGEAAGDAAGYAVAGAGDGLGGAGVWVGAPYQDAGGTSAGAVYLVPAGTTGVVSLGAAGVKLTGVSVGDQAGLAVSSAGDVNGDGYIDALIGAPYEDTAGGNAGAAYLVYGPVLEGLGLSAADATLWGEASSDLAGAAVAGAGDVNGDGYDDLLLGAPSALSNGERSGAAYLVYGPVSSSRSLELAERKLGGEAESTAGVSLAGGGDLDQDGTVDVVIGASSLTVDGAQVGGAYVVGGE